MLKVVDLEKSYKKNNVLKKVSFELKTGKTCALIGENGAGKSTLIEIICGVKKMDKGGVFLDGLDLSNKKNAKKAKFLFGYMPQHFSLYHDLTVKENLIYVASIYSIKDKNRVKETIGECFLSNVENTLAGNLSGGYKQLLSMAAAILHNPKFLILDEPSSAMDPIFRKKFWKIISKLNSQGVTVLIITHYLEELLECEDFMCLSKGKIVYAGKVDEFKKENFINIEAILNKFKEGDSDE